MIAYILLALGFLLIFLEFLLPGSLLGILGGVAVLSSIIFFAMQADNGLWVFFYVLAIGIFLIFFVRFILWRIRRKKWFYLDSDQEGFVASSYEKEYVGKEGVALSDLRPSGYIEVEGKPLQAVAESGYIAQNEKIKIISGRGSYYIVKRMDHHESNSSISK